MSEIELKYCVDARRASAVEAALRRAGGVSSTIESRYFDTAQGHLADAGLSLRLRRVDGTWEQTLKAPGAGPAVREEETVPRPGTWGSDGPPVAPDLHAGTKAGKALDAALRDAGEGALQFAHASFIRRRIVEVEVGDARIEVAFDQGEIRSNGKSEPVCEVEYELKSGPAAALASVARAGVREHGLWLSTLAKSTRGDRLFRAGAARLARKARQPHLRRSMNGAAILRAVMTACLDQVLANASEIAAGRVDDELVHQLRVGLRRMRTAARELGSLGPSLGKGWEAAVTGVFRVLGAYRDRRAVADALQVRLAEAGSPAAQLQPSGSADADPVVLVRGGAFQIALLEVLAFTLETDDDAGLGTNAALSHIGGRLDKLHDHLRRSARSFHRLEPAERHQARKRLKRLRYVSELVGSLYGNSAVKRYLDRLAPAQDELGTYMDLVVGSHFAHEQAEGGAAESWFNVGWLTAEIPASVKRCRKALRHAARAKPFWAGRG